MPRTYHSLRKQTTSQRPLSNPAPDRSNSIIILNAAAMADMTNHIGAGLFMPELSNEAATQLLIKHFKDMDAVAPVSTDPQGAQKPATASISADVMAQRITAGSTPETHDDLVTRAILFTVDNATKGGSRVCVTVETGAAVR
ncbi:hypothetical protein IMZ48_24795 [Candidatus Bathyarchaeota archaeon]|nr:hypothetical protein [Candidatus Bathyarchaeota archaeon]